MSIHRKGKKGQKHGQTAVPNGASTLEKKVKKMARKSGLIYVSPPAVFSTPAQSRQNLAKMVFFRHKIILKVTHHIRPLYYKGMENDVAADASMSLLILTPFPPPNDTLHTTCLLSRHAGATQYDFHLSRVPFQKCLDT